MRIFSSRYSRAALLGAGLLAGCANLVDLGEPDSSIVSPGAIKTYEGARGLYYGTIGTMAQIAGTYAMQTALFTDELNSVGASSPVDARTGNDISDTPLNELFKLLSQGRAQAQQALGALALYPGQALPAMSAELYALQGMTEVLLAELFCNGVPLATTPYGGDFSYSGAVSTHDVLTRAVAHFDTALTLTDSAAIVTLARVGKGRALIDLGQFDGAAAAVATVATDATYGFTYSAIVGENNPVYQITFGQSLVYSVTSNEGINGLEWLSADPRVPLIPGSYGAEWAQNKYATSTTPFIFADGLEARLIEAEARLRAKNYSGWITLLQTLAQAVPGVPIPADPGPVAGTDSARITVHFRERAYWLYLTGHRQGDTRRLIRQYGRPQLTVVPVGPYTPTDYVYPVYGRDIAIAPPRTERENNPLYRGCLDQKP